eukprot:CAMPEP_0201243670 /NCGR_PEP_ID=MMETSP0852-20130820/42048_1 /ASSEMBLY_ACC=CAM_ASM_000632 /TAXON_ID=183588 /ORGANISM="Pseudo-nitzschia fraudulenta, Strain WWA7" /LENGTH=67 /DNA_ID=CAMNT_0047540777 /DNA_START=7 /DNA_END=206 /DNA_ORIENTATION=-
MRAGFSETGFVEGQSPLTVFKMNIAGVRSASRDDAVAATLLGSSPTREDRLARPAFSNHVEETGGGG